MILRIWNEIIVTNNIEANNNLQFPFKDIYPATIVASYMKYKQENNKTSHITIYFVTRYIRHCQIYYLDLVLTLTPSERKKERIYNMWTKISNVNSISFAHLCCLVAPAIILHGIIVLFDRPSEIGFCKCYVRLL